LNGWCDDRAHTLDLNGDGLRGFGETELNLGVDIGRFEIRDRSNAFLLQRISDLKHYVIAPSLSTKPAQKTSDSLRTWLLTFLKLSRDILQPCRS